MRYQAIIANRWHVRSRAAKPEVLKYRRLELLNIKSDLTVDYIIWHSRRIYIEGI